MHRIMFNCSHGSVSGIVEGKAYNWTVQLTDGNLFLLIRQLR